ncbi:hypothetical protein [Metabacillus fastidiosus]|uniref:hypothetical protein n=1 Tax=Metabacillus fastidiosus TaxID=1458 RepID=UPI003D28729A
MDKCGFIPSRTKLIEISKKDNILREGLGMYSSVYKYGGIIQVKLELFDYCIENNLIIPEDELMWLLRIAENKNIVNSKYYATNEQVNWAKQILQSCDLSFVREILKEDKKEKEKSFKSEVFNVFEYMVKRYGCILSETECHLKKKLDTYFQEINIYKRIRRRKLSLIQLKLDFLEKIINEYFYISDKDLNWLKNTSKGESTNQLKPTDQEQKFALYVLQIYENIPLEKKINGGN